MEPKLQTYVANLIKEIDTGFGTKKDGKITKDETDAITMFQAKLIIDKQKGIITEEDYNLLRPMSIDGTIFDKDLSKTEEVGDTVTVTATTGAATGKTPKEEEKTTTKEESKFEKRREELAKVSEKELKETKLFKYTDVGGFQDQGDLSSGKLTMFDILSKDYLNKDLAEDKDGKLTERIKAKNPKATDEEIKSLVDAEKEKRQRRFNEDGTYNLQELADDVIKTSTIGTDYTLNQSTDKDNLGKEHSDVLYEFMQTVMPGESRHEYYRKLGIGHALGGDDNKIYNKKDIKMAENVVEFLGGTVEKYNFWQRHKSEPVENGVQQGVANALTQAANPLAYAEQTQVTNITTDLGLQQVLQHQLVITGPLNALIGLATSVAVGEIDAAIKNYYGKLKDEDIAIKLDPLKGPKYEAERTNLDAFIAAIDGDKSCDKFKAETKDVLKEIASYFQYQHCTGEKDDQGNWIYETRFDYDEMYKYLREVGSNDKCNAQELASSIITNKGKELLKYHIEQMNKNAEERNARCQDCPPCPQDGKEEKPPVNPPENPPENPEEDRKGNGQVAERTIPYHTVDATHSTWNKLTESYDCLTELGNSVTKDAKTGKFVKTSIRILKMVQCIGDGDYSKERINKLLTIVSTAKTNEEFEKMLKDNNIDFNYDLYKKIVYDKKYAMPGAKTKMPKELYGCDYKEIDNRVKLTKKQQGTGVGSFNEGVKDKTQYRRNDDDGTGWKPSDSTTNATLIREKGYKPVDWSETEK